MGRGNEDARKLDGLPGEYVAPDGVTPERGARRRRDDIPSDYVLIGQTQRYFERLRRREDPGAELLAAWERFFRLYDVLLRRYAARLGILEPDMNDLLQDVWRGLMRTMETFERHSDCARFRTWLYAVVEKKVLAFRRQRARRESRITLTDQSDELDIRFDDHDPARQDDGDLHHELLRYALERLRPKIPEISYRILELRFLEGHTVAETARLLNLDPRHVTFRLCRVLKKLRQLLDFYAAEPA